MNEARVNLEKSLDLSDFNLNEIPKGINILKHLEILNLSHNEIEKIEYLDQLENLKELYLNNNRHGF